MDSAPPDSISPDDPLVLEFAEEGVAPYRGLLPPEALEELRTTLIWAMISHPYPQALIAQLHKRGAVQKSTTTKKNGLPGETAERAHPAPIPLNGGRKPR
jgi:hypothetical protein